MAVNLDEIETICECQCILACSGEYRESRKEMKDDVNGVPNVHEIDEEESETEEEEEKEEAATSEQLNFSAPNKENVIVSQETKDASENEFAYTGESFCSDESYDESEITNVTSESLISDSFSLLRVADPRRGESSKARNTKADGRDREEDDLRNDESYSLNENSSRPPTADRFAKSRRCKRWNMSFTDDEMRKIERDNELLLRKIMAQQRPRHKTLGERTIQPRTSSSAINRRKLQKKIENDNMLLLKRIQQAKSCVLTNASKMGCRLTFL